MAIIYHQLRINAPAAKVYESISLPDRIGTWWDKQTVTETNRGTVLEHNPGPEHGIVKLRVVELIPNRRVEWECISTHPQSSPAFAWKGTHFTFDLTDNEARSTTVDFRQTGYDEHSKFYGSNNFAWAQVLLNLKRVLEA